jgi:predicted phosphodiesterase
MKYAVFSDMHGNLPAFRAALADAESRGAGMSLILGDFVNGLPWSEEVTRLVRDLSPAAVIRGNHGDYMIEMMEQDPGEWVYEQFKLIYWCHSLLSKESLSYLASLPAKTAVWDGKGGKISLAHSSGIFYRSPQIRILHTSGYGDFMETAGADKNAEGQEAGGTGSFSDRYASARSEKYSALVLAELLARPEAVNEMLALPRGIYLFGHNHIQLHLEYEGRVFVNPGSCGFTCQRETAASYALIEFSGGEWDIEERKVGYDVSAAAEGLRNSTLREHSPVWHSVIERQLLTGRDSFSPLMRRLREANGKQGKSGFPVGNDIWEIAVKGYYVN